ncbi:MAG TPA: aspartate/glutamate racemase family protein [Thermoanaerobaculia bacterium]|nr:aspartate/glutamate racemase family protein [Thermoanaerobaculia bacterium]
MHILITDSGVGGLSVCAYAERYVRTHGFREPVRLTFANAAPANDYGYNSMPTRELKIETFDRFLRNINARSAPDFIYVACNTLSVLLPDTPFARKPPVPVQGIIGTAIARLVREIAPDPRRIAMIFGTQTTIDAGAYPRLLHESGIEVSRIVSQACPGLADVISEDREGTKTKREIERWVAAAIAKMPRRGVPVAACLACTHYGYRRDLFAAALSEAGIEAAVINPNERAVDDLFDDAPPTSRDVIGVEFVTRYAIPPATIEALSWFLSDISPRTVEAMRDFVHAPDLF